MRKNTFSHFLKIVSLGFLIAAYLPTAAFAIFDDKEKEAMRLEIETLKKENEKITRDLNEVKSDRDNVLKQIKNFMTEKDQLAAQLKQAQSSGSESGVERDSLKKELDLLKSDLAQSKNILEKAKEMHRGELEAREKVIADMQAKNNSLMLSMEKYTPSKIQEIEEDRIRLDLENKKMAARLLENERRMGDLKKQMTPFELDREEMFKLRSENKELQGRAQYALELEGRQKQLLRENAEYREKLEVLKAKFKDAVPGLAKSSRISQKMMRENADMHYNLGTIFLKNKQYKEAIKEYQRVLELRPNDSETHYNLGVLYDDYLRDREKALYHYQKYLAINPKSADAKKVETYILSLELEQKIR